MQSEAVQGFYLPSDTIYTSRFTSQTVGMEMGFVASFDTGKNNALKLLVDLYEWFGL